MEHLAEPTMDVQTEMEVREALAALPPRQAEAWRCYWEGWQRGQRPPRAAEIAEVMAVRPATVRSHLRFARRKMRHYFGEAG